MIIKRMIKFTLCALMLGASVLGYAQGDSDPEEPTVPTKPTGSVKLKNGLIKTWEEFANAVNNPETIKGEVSDAEQQAWNKADSTYRALVRIAGEAADSVTKTKKEYETANKNLSTWQSQLTALNYSNPEPMHWLATVKTNSKKFLDSAEEYIVATAMQESFTDPSYKIHYTQSSTILIVSFANEKPESLTTSATVSEFYTNIITNSNVTIKNLYIYFGDSYVDEDDNLINKGRYTVSNYTKNPSKDLILSDVQDAIDAIVKSGDYDVNKKTKQTLLANIKKLTDPLKDEEGNTITNADGSAKTRLDELFDAYQQAEKNKTDADETVSKEKTKYDQAYSDYQQAIVTAQANAKEYYNDVTLTEDVTAKAQITRYSGTINGGGKIITLEGITSLFDAFSGNLTNVAINGNLAETLAGAKMASVAFWDNANNNGEVYSNKGNETSYNNIGALGFAARAKFGIDFTTGQLTALTDESKVYNITIYDGPNKTDANKYVQIRKKKTETETETDKLVTGANSTVTEVKLPVNMFAKSETNDLKGFTNVFYFDGSKNVCDNVKITDRESFYCPFEITATKMTYGRTFKAGNNAVCLPFELSKGLLNLENDNDFICTYDQEAKNTFWFTKTAGEIPANTPALLVLSEDKQLQFPALEGITIKKTETQLPLKTATNNKSTSYGTFKQAYRDEFVGEYEAGRVFGLAGDEFRLAAENATFPAFRMVIACEREFTNGAPRRIGILDENGVEITDFTTGVESVKMDASSLSINGGQGEIRFTSETDLGNVAIYTMDGKMAAMANVKAGTSTVNIQKGIYIVMGKKVMVK